MKTNKIIKLIFEQILLYLLIAIFSIRLLCYKTNIGSYVGLDSISFASNNQALISLIAIWFTYTAIILTIMRSFFKFKTIKTLVRYITIPIFILDLLMINTSCMLLTGSNEVSLLKILLICEAIIGIVISLYYLLSEIVFTKQKDMSSFKQILFTLGMFLLMLIASLPSYFIQFVFGYGNDLLVVKEIRFEHRIFLYLAIIIPFVIYFLLRRKTEEVIRFTLIYISIATMIGFLVNYNYENILQPWSWPFHLCNTAMFIVPLVLIFKMKRLFYFTYFINVMGALLAMIMPNYDKGTNIFSMRIFNFWYNHWIAFFMPILLVALKCFKRPTIKEFYYSMIGFLVYFLLALFFNVFFTAIGHTVDYFFINSNFVADKLGTWAEDLFNLNAIITIGKYKLEFHPLYQLIFFLTYVGLGLGVWFIYNEFFRIADNHYELQLKLHNMKLHEYALVSALDEKRKEKLMSSNPEAVLEIQHLTKRYASSEVYAVFDANLTVKGGEIFGFLGPNGAGKSTIIKSIVGIQTITDGSVSVCGYDVATQPVECKYHIGYVPDHYALYEKLTGREYINYIADIYEVSEEERTERIEKYIKIFELEHSIDSKIRTYSHGMKQKITIMSALVHNPKVWILDEPLTGLDPNSIYQVKECMRQHASEGNIVFFSSHLIDIVEKLCQSIAIIKHGHIQCVKSLKEIEDTGVTLEEYYMDVIKDNLDDSEKVKHESQSTTVIS